MAKRKDFEGEKVVITTTVTISKTAAEMFGGEQDVKHDMRKYMYNKVAKAYDEVQKAKNNAE